MRLILRHAGWLLWLWPLLATSQDLPKHYQKLPVNDKRSFSGFPDNWSLIERAAIHPQKENAMSTQPGNNLLLGKAGKRLTPAFTGKNLRLYLEFQLTPKASGYLHLPGGARILLTDHPDLTPSENTSGYIVRVPSQNAVKAPGLWQTLELDYESILPAHPGTGKVNHLLLNGISIQQSVFVPLKDTSASVSFEITAGSMLFRTIGYQVFEDRKPAQLANLTYKLYSDAWNSRQTNRLEQSGTAPGLTQEVTMGKKEYNLVLEGDLLLEEDGLYTFTTLYNGPYCQLSIDGTVVNDSGESTSQDAHTGTITLAKGSHKLRLWYSKFPWMAAALGVLVEKPGIRAYPLHTLSSLPQPTPKPFIMVHPEQKAEMVRSFVQYGTEKHKRTHCLSVGGPAGWHYTADLNRGALLQVWKGEFANTTDMWYERGEPQLLHPVGLVVPISGKSSLANLPAPATAWPDSANIRYLGYRLDAQGFPALRYNLGGITVSDALVATSGGLVRTLTPEGTVAANWFVLAAAAANITLVENGLYNINDQFYVRFPGTAKPRIRTVGQQKELILPLTSSVTYTLFW